MASTFQRGYNAMPTIEEIGQIEGIVMVDNQPPGGLGGTPSSYACVVGEFADMTQSVTYGTDGSARPSYRAHIVTSAANFEDNLGGFDPALGQFGAAMGNGYVSVTGKVFGTARLQCLPVRLYSAFAGRMWRQLPTCRGSFDPSPIAPLVAARVPAAYEFRLGTDRVRTAVRATFTADAYFASAVDGSVTAAGAVAATQTFNAASGDFRGASVPSRKVYVGDMLVLGTLGALGPLGANADTYRVVSITSGTAIVVQKLDGTSFDWTTGVALPWRIHPGAAADTSGRKAGGTVDGFVLANPAGYNVAGRPLDNTIAAATTVNPTVAPPTPTSTVWDALSGLKFRTHPLQPLTYTAAVQAPNVANSAIMDARYQEALDGLLVSRSPEAQIRGVVCSRKSSTIALALRQHCLNSFAGGNPRVAFISPPVNTLLVSDVIAASYPGVEPLRNARVEYHWPAVRALSLRDAVGVSLGTSDGATTIDGSLDVPMDEYRLALFTRLPPEESPAEAIEPVPTTFATIVDYARGVQNLALGDYEVLKARGICAIKIDTPPAQIQSAVNTLLPTAALDPKVPANRQVFADWCMASLALIAAPFKSVLETQAQIDALTAALFAFLESLGPEGSGVTPQRIKAFKITRISTAAEEELGVIKYKIDIKMLATMDYIVLSVTAGTTVQITQEA
mgnify:CR=1 FL=1